MNNACPPTLNVNGDYASWRVQALRALAAGWAPEALTWTEDGVTRGADTDQMTLDYGGAAPASDKGATWGQENAPVSVDTRDAIGARNVTTVPNGTNGTTVIAEPAPAIRISKALADLLQDAALFRSTQRWAFLWFIEEFRGRLPGS